MRFESFGSKLIKETLVSSIHGGGHFVYKVRSEPEYEFQTNTSAFSKLAFSFDPAKCNLILVQEMIFAGSFNVQKTQCTTSPESPNETVYEPSSDHPETRGFSFLF